MKRNVSLNLQNYFNITQFINDSPRRFDMTDRSSKLPRAIWHVKFQIEKFHKYDSDKR